MESDNVGQKNHTQLIITLGLVGVLVCIIGGYIYMGMWWAKQAPVQTPMVVEDVVPAAEILTPNELEQRQQIFEALEQATGTEVTAEDRNSILEALEGATSTVSDERKTEMLDALN